MPLPYQLANGTHAHLLPMNLYHKSNALIVDYGALIQVSLGYSPAIGRLHTRYAPVRRSQGCKHPLPLDLHVLGLPLAFILSQDQTLHRIIFNNIATIHQKSPTLKKFPGFSLSLVFLCRPIPFQAAVYAVNFNISMNLSSLFCPLPNRVLYSLIVLAGANVQLFFNPTILFKKYFRKFS